MNSPLRVTRMSSNGHPLVNLMWPGMCERSRQQRRCARSCVGSGCPEADRAGYKGRMGLKAPGKHPHG